MCTCPCLAILDFSAPFMVECDACKLGVGAVDAEWIASGF